MATKTADTHRDPSDVITEALMELVWQLIKAAAVLVWWVVLFPMISVPLGLAVAAGVLVGWQVGVVVVGVFAAGIMLWRWKRPEMFERWVSRRARHRFLTWFRYRRRWIKLLTACHLVVTYDDTTLIPRLVGVQIGDSIDRVKVRMLAGQCPDDYENRVSHLAHAFGAQECRASIVGPALVELVFRHADSLAEAIDLPRSDGGRWDKGVAA